MPTYDSPVNVPHGVTSGDPAGLPSSPREDKPALMPLHPRFDHGIDVCAVLRDGSIEFVARDVFTACGLELDDALQQEPGHDVSFAEHATARTWSRELIGDILTAANDFEIVRDFLFWLDAQIDELTTRGLDTVERNIRYGNGHRPADVAVAPQSTRFAVPPAFYPIAGVAKILSRDPGIGKIGRDALFTKLQILGWINKRTGGIWRPAPEVLAFGWLTVQKIAVPTKDQAYPQIVITPAGIEALHERLGGTTTLQYQSTDHLTLIEANS